MNILYLYSSMNPLNGGIERVTSILYNKLQDRGHNVYCIGMRRDHLAFEEKMIYLPNKKKENSVQNVNFVENFIRDNKIEHVIAQIAGPNETSDLLMSIKNNVQKIACIHLDILDSKRHFGTSRSSLLKQYHLGWLSRLFDTKIMGFAISYLYVLLKRSKYRTLYMNCNKVVLLSKSFIADYEFVAGEKNISNLVSISNPLPELGAFELNPSKSRVVLYVGRINTSQKKVDYLLKIWEKVYPLHPDWTLKIVGGGSELEMLKDMANKMNLKQYSFEGYKDPFPYYKDASIFCMTSSYEGFGMVLLEAMHFGTVPIAFDSYGAVYDIIEHNENGLLVKSFNLDEYASTLSSIMKDEDFRRKMSYKAKQSIEKFNIDNIVDSWCNLFENK